MEIGDLVRVRMTAGYSSRRGELGIIVDKFRSKKYPYTIKFLSGGKLVNFGRDELEEPQDDCEQA